jgi:hypothetical protein
MIHYRFRAMLAGGWLLQGHAEAAEWLGLRGCGSAGKVWRESRISWVASYGCLGMWLDSSNSHTRSFCTLSNARNS